MPKEQIIVNDQKFLINVHYELRENSTASLGRKSINIRIPLSLNREEQFRELLKMKSWVMNKLGENPDHFRPKATRTYKDGDLLKVGSEEYELSLNFKDTESSSGRMYASKICLNISSNLPEDEKKRHISSLLSRIIARKRLPGLKQRIFELNKKHFSQPLTNIYFKNSRSNWGSCSEKGNINISTRLLFAPDGVIEYVCIHELAHLTEFNHSEKFWGLVEKAMPDYREKKQWLKENRNILGF